MAIEERLPKTTRKKKKRQTTKVIEENHVGKDADWTDRKAWGMVTGRRITL